MVLEVLKEEKTLKQIANKNNILPKNLINWKKTFLENMEIALEPAKAVKKCKKQIKDLKKKVDKYAKTVGKLTVERDCPSSCRVVASLGRTVGKLKSLDLLTKREMMQVQTKKEDTLLAPSKKTSIAWY